MNTSDLKTKALILARSAWNRQDLTWLEIQSWLSHFSGAIDAADSERDHALYLLTQFTYFGSEEIRELLKALYREHVLYPVLEALRTSMGDSRDHVTLEQGARLALKGTRFAGVGGSSSSGTHLLYLFRQENSLPTSMFLELSDIPDSTVDHTVHGPCQNVSRLIFIDDICGSGHTVEDLWHNELKDFAAANPRVELVYLALFGIGDGLQYVRSNTGFSDASTALFELDSSYCATNSDSRYTDKLPSGLQKATIDGIINHYGAKLSSIPRGYEECALLLGFHHNTPDNTLPIFWEKGSVSFPWRPPFRRYKKEEASIP